MSIKINNRILSTKTVEGIQKVQCIIRKKYLVLTPEEFVRQQLLKHLIDELGYSKNLIQVEKQLTLNGLKKRPDIVCFNNNSAPFLLIECKAINQPINQGTFNQVAQYNLVWKVPYLAVSNLKTTIIAKVDLESKEFEFVTNWPTV